VLLPPALVDLILKVLAIKLSVAGDMILLALPVKILLGYFPLEIVIFPLGKGRHLLLFLRLLRDEGGPGVQLRLLLDLLASEQFLADLGHSALHRLRLLSQDTLVAVLRLLEFVFVDLQPLVDFIVRIYEVASLAANSTRLVSLSL